MRWVVLLTSLLFAGSAAAAPEFVGRASVIDGDTIEIRGERLRLHGIDAPESGQWCTDAADRPYRCGQRASFALADKIGAGNVRCEALDTDHYGRTIARCHLGSTDLNGWMGEAGWALAYRQFSREYVPQENAARGARRGMWQGRFDAPWDWRRGMRTVTSEGVGRTSGSRPRSPDCVIKGNINRDGERIYHVPGQAFYDRTIIRKELGQRWFCSEAEARAAGWRPARR